MGETLKDILIGIGLAVFVLLALWDIRRSIDR